MTSNNVAAHLALALTVSAGLSGAFWIAYGVFELVPALIVTPACAAAGAALGWIARRNLLITAVLTMVIRGAAYLLATSGGA